jgi:hypothetical protein
LGTDGAVAFQEFMKRHSEGDDGLQGNVLFWLAFAPRGLVAGVGVTHDAAGWIRSTTPAECALMPPAFCHKRSPCETRCPRRIAQTRGTRSVASASDSCAIVKLHVKHSQFLESSRNAPHPRSLPICIVRVIRPRAPLWYEKSSYSR